MNRHSVRLTHCALLVALSALNVGCSDSGNDSATSTPPDSDAGGLPFAVADVNGTSDVARLGYPEVRDLSRDLITGAYLNRYFDIDIALSTLAIEAAEAGDNAEYACPDGGTISASKTSPAGPLPSYSATFSDCALEGRTLSGSLNRDFIPGVFGSGSYIKVTATFDELDIRGGEGERLLISGTAMRQRSESSAAVGVERGSCTLETDNVSLIETSAITSALIAETGIAGSVSIADHDHDRWDASFHDASADVSVCPVTVAIRETGSLTADFNDYGHSAMNGRANIATTISKGMAEAVDMATQSSELPDGSTVAVTALDDQDGKVQVDVFADGTAISFFDDYEFTGQDFMLSH